MPHFLRAWWSIIRPGIDRPEGKLGTGTAWHCCGAGSGSGAGAARNHAACLTPEPTFIIFIQPLVKILRLMLSRESKLEGFKARSRPKRPRLRHIPLHDTANISTYTPNSKPTPTWGLSGSRSRPSAERPVRLSSPEHNTVYRYYCYSQSWARTNVLASRQRQSINAATW